MKKYDHKQKWGFKKIVLVKLKIVKKLKGKNIVVVVIS